jgi:hypothetical protein
MTEAGFYKNLNGRLLYAPNSVIGKGYSLSIATKDTTRFPVDGWSWFNTLAQASAALKVASVTPAVSAKAVVTPAAAPITAPAPAVEAFQAAPNHPNALLEAEELKTK